MKNLKYFQKLFESAPRIPTLDEKGKKYWYNKGKRGQDVMVYTHDDMDGIYSAIVVKERLKELGYNIIGYGVLNYQEGWKNTSLDEEIINVAVDFANMPDPERKELIDIYIDHHGVFTEEEKEFYSKDPVIKTDTGSAYLGICQVIGQPTDEIILYSIDMIDSAKYDDYKVDWRDIINFSWDRFLEIAKKEGKVTIKPFEGSKSVELGYPIIAKLTFAGAFNQLIKRSDYKTLIEVIDNVKSPSIYGIYNAMKKIYPGNNVWNRGYSKGKEKDFIEDSTWRIETMKKRTRGGATKKIFTNQQEFIKSYVRKDKGYQIIGNLMFVPSGTWANALRARSILLKDMDNGIVPENQVDFIMLQYGNTIQVCGFDKLEEMESYPVLNDGTEVKNLASYMSRILSKFQEYFGYFETSTEVGQDELTVSGGHVGIGTISNIVGKVDIERSEKSRSNLSDLSRKLISKYTGHRYLDLFKNKIISDLSGLGDKKWPIGFIWSQDDEDPKLQMVRDIMGRDPQIKERIENWVEENSLSFPTKSSAEREIKRIIKDELMNTEKEALEEIHQQVMKDHKVLMKKDVRQMDRRGQLNEAKLKYIKRFDSF